MDRLVPIIEVRNIGKSFGATRALENVSLEFYPGEVLAMVGANGAGKSTLIKIICGYHADFEGDIIIKGSLVHLAAPKDALDNGITTIHQNINQGVVQSMSVYENLTLAELLAPGQSPFYDKRVLRSHARDAADLMGLEVDLDALVEDLNQSDRQLIAIARALAEKPKLLILDEPTSSLSDRETERLFDILEKLKTMGVSILYVSHRLHEISRIADRVAVLRDGTNAGMLVSPFDVKDMVTRMVGEIPKHTSIVRSDELDDMDAKIELRDLVTAEGQSPINLRVRAGEILGVTGLIGAGKSELAHVLFGIRRPISGSILLDGRRISPRSVGEAVAKGIFYVPEDRSNNAVVPMFTVRQNITLPFLRFFDRLGIMNVGLERRHCRAVINAMGIKCDGEDADMDSLSGGNQQKVIVARWLIGSFELVILDEPFQGVDIRSRHEIGRYLRENIGDKAAIVIAADLDEIIEVADRIVVMNAGMIVGEQFDENIDRDQLLHWISMDSVNEAREAIRA